MIITESELRRIIRQEILNESLSINISEEELLEEGIKDKLGRMLSSLGIAAIMFNPIFKHAKAEGIDFQNPKSIEILADSFADGVPEICPDDQDSWWNIHGNKGAPQNIRDISIASSDYLRDARGKGNFIGNDVALSVKLNFGSDMRMHNLIMSIASRFKDPNMLTNDMKNIDAEFNKNRSSYLKSDESDPETRLSQLKAWEYVKSRLEAAGNRAIKSGNIDEYNNVRRELLTLSDNTDAGDKEYDNKQYGSAQAKLYATSGDLR